jgi:2-polyprenyl-3-methyl-5-hydroxy-6-metoxy-1,4-benzoquinol methylase
VREQPAGDGGIVTEPAAPEVLDRPPAEFYDQDDSDNVCFLCGQPEYELVHEVRTYSFPFTFQRCRCGLEKQTPMPNERFFEWFFNSDIFFSAKESKANRIWGFYDYFKDEPSRLATSRRRYRKLAPFLETGRPLEIMKIGPSTGTFLHTANQHGHHAIGADVSSQFVEYARENYDVRIDHGRFEHLDYADGEFDVILLFNVIENVPNLPEFLESVHRRLKPGGHFILNHVRMERNLVARMQGQKYFMYRPPICYAFTTSVLQRVLEKYGFHVRADRADIRYMTLEKIMTLLHWRLPLRLFELLRIQRIPFPIYAYPSRILVTQRD